MESFSDVMKAYQQQLKRGAIQKAYRGLMDYMLALRGHFKNTCPEYPAPGGLYLGYMDMTYFSINPPALKDRGLKIAIVFLNEEFRFEVWLSGYNRQIQARCWQMLKDRGWQGYRLVADPQSMDAILEHVLADDPDFSDLDALTRQIEVETLRFIAAIEHFLAQNPG